MALAVLLELSIFRRAQYIAPALSRAYAADAALTRETLAWPRLEISSLPSPRILDTNPAAKQKQKREPIALGDALQEIQARARARFDETVDVRFALGTNPKRGDQMVRGALALPHGTGKEPRICVFASGIEAADARAAGAEVIGDQDLIAKIQQVGSSAIAFDTCLGTRDMMPQLTKIARVLGPRGLMPNPKLGTLIEPGGMQSAVSAMKRGRVEYRADKSAIVQAGIGKVSFTQEHLTANFAAFAAALLSARPKGVKGSGVTGYILSVLLSSTMGPGVPVSISSLIAILQARERRRS